MANTGPTDRPRHPARRAALAVAVLVAAAVLAAFVLARLDAGFLKARLEAAALRATGRPLQINGAVHLTLLPAPGITAADVALGNIPGGSRPAMLRVAEVAATIDPLALLAGHLDVRSLVLTRPDLLIERTPDGRPNWVFSPAAAPRTSRGATGAASRGGGLRLRVDSLYATGGQVAWAHVRGPDDGGSFLLDHLLAQQHDAASSFTLHLVGRHGAAPFTLSVASASPLALGAAGPARPFPVRASLGVGEDAALGQATVDGQFTDPVHGRGFSGVVHARLRSAADLAPLFPRAGLPPMRGLEFTARALQEGDGHWSLRALSATVEAADAGRILPGMLLARSSVEAPDQTAPIAVHAAGTLRGQAIDLDAMALGSLAAWSDTGSPTAPVVARLRAGSAEARLDGSVTRGGDGSRTLTGTDHVAVPDPAAVAALFGRSIDRHVAIVTDGHLAVGRSAGGAEWTGVAGLDRLLLDGAALPSARIDLDVRRAPPGDFAVRVAEAGGAPWLIWQGRDDEQPTESTLVLNGHLVPASLVSAIAGVGRGVSGGMDLAGTIRGIPVGSPVDPDRLAGDFSVTLVDGLLAGETARALLGPASRLTHLAIGKGGAERVRCAGAAGLIGGGTVTLQTLSLDSRLLDVEGDGTIGLARGALSLHLRPVVKLGVAAASAPVTVGGTLDAPTGALARDGGGRVALSIGGNGGAQPTRVACDANPDVAALPAAKAPKAADILRSLGLFR